MVRVLVVVIIIMVWFAGLGLDARIAPEGVIDTVLVRSMDATGDGQLDTVSLHLMAKRIESPFSWVLSIRSRGILLYRYSGEDSAIDTLFHDEGYVVGCNNYLQCKKRYYFHDILDRLEVPYNLEGILDRTQSNTLYRVGRAYLDTCCAIRGGAADAILSAMERRLRNGTAVVIAIPRTPQTREQPMMFVPEVNRFVTIYQE